MLTKSQQLPKLNILFLADAVFEDKPGGSRVVARELARGLAARGHQVTFLVARHDAESPDDVTCDGVRIVRYLGAGNPAAFVRAGRLAAARLAAEGAFDVAHTHFAYAALGPLAALGPTLPHVRSFYGPWHEEGWVEDTQRGLGGVSGAKARLKRMLRRQVERANLRRSDAVAVLSRHSHGEVTALGFPEARIHEIPGGVDVARFAPARGRADVRRSLGLPDNRVVLLTVRRLAARMGLDSLVAACGIVAARHPQVLLLIGGKGPEQARLEALIAEHNLAEHVRLVGFIPDAQLTSYYQAADAFVLPTAALEGFGLVTVEALACGTPALGTPVGATPEILTPLDPRLVLPGTGPKEIAQGISDFLEADWRNALTPDRLRQYVLDRYTWDRHVDGMLEVYAGVIAAKGGSPHSASFLGHPLPNLGEGGALARRVRASPSGVSAPRTILYLDHTAKMGGGEIALLNLIGGLDRTRFLPVVALGSDGPLAERLRDAGVATHILPLSRDVVDTRKDSLGAESLLKARQAGALFAYAVCLARFARRQRVDIIHTNSLKSDLYGGLAGRLARTPVIWHIRDNIDSDYLPSRVAAAFRALCRIVPTVVVANSHSTMGRLDVPVKRKVVVHDGCLVDLYAAQTAEREPGQVVTLVGRLASWKGQHIFLEAVATLADRDPDTRFWVVGAPLFGETDYEASLHAMAQARGIADRVVFWGHREDVPALLARTDILVHASTLGEPFGQVVIEGMAAGKPVIATNGGALPEIVLPETTGLLVPMGDAAAMAAAIARLLDDPALAARMGAAGRERVAEKFTIGHAVAKIQEVYDSLFPSASH